MKLSDYVAEFLVRQNICHTFLISGGAIIHCADSVASHPQLQYICTQHEQGAGAAADAYARVSGNLGAVLVTSGPGATNLLTSVCNAYFDSIPGIFICGQVARFRLRSTEHLRQKGFQETDIVSIFKPVTKYAVQILKAEDIKYELTKAVYLARSGRPGPVVIDLPDDLQRVDIDLANLREFIPPASLNSAPSDFQIQQILQWLTAAQRPVLILGAGVRIAGAVEEAISFAERFHLPVLLTWGAKDFLPYDHPLNAGGFGVCGPRGGNFSVQTSDFVLAIGTRLSQLITGGKQDLFASNARKVMVDIDAQELKKFLENELKLDLAIESDCGQFFKHFKKCDNETHSDRYADWHAQIKEWTRRYPICLPEYYEQDKINIYPFMKELSKAAKEGDIIITDAGGNLSWTMQAFDVKKNQRLFSAWNHSPMGYSMPASIGAALASPGTDVICIIGDGGLMMCVEELATIRKYNLSVKIFVINNHGHGIQKQTLETWMNSRFVAVDEKTGLAFPDFVKVGETFGFPSLTIESYGHLNERLKKVLSTPGPVLCNVEIDESQKITPMLKFGSGLEDLSPSLPKEEVACIMKIARPLEVLNRLI